MGRESRVKRATPKTPRHPTPLDYAKPPRAVTRAEALNAQLGRLVAKIEDSPIEP